MIIKIILRQPLYFIFTFQYTPHMHYEDQTLHALFLNKHKFAYRHIPPYVLEYS